MAAMTDDANGSVRITNAAIFEELRSVHAEVRGVKQSVDETLKPGLADARADIRSLREHKADKTETTALRGEISSVRVQAYAISGGVLAGLVALRTLGVI